MAGAGYKLFSTGDVLSASDVNTYLMQQTVMSFASSAARTTALASVLAEGMVTYLQDTNVVEIYTGAAWVSLDDPNAIQNTLLTTTGDTIYASSANTPARRAIGTTGQVLTVAGGIPTWATPAGSSGAVTQITDTTLGSAAADITFSSIPSTYNHLMIIISGRCSSGSVNGTDLLVQLNSDTGVNYRHARNTKYGAAGSTVTIEGGNNFSSMSLGNLWGGTSNSNTISGAQMIFPNYKGTTLTKSMIFNGGCMTDSPGAGSGFGQWINFSAVTTIKIFSTGGNLDTGTRATLYGWT